MKKLFGFIAAGVALVTSAVAQTYTPSENVFAGSMVNRANITSVTTPSIVSVQDPRQNVSVFLLGGAANQSATIAYMDGNTVLVSESVAVTANSVISRTVPAPLYFDGVRVSVTTVMSNNAISATVIQVPAFGYRR